LYKYVLIYFITIIIMGKKVETTSLNLIFNIYLIIIINIIIMEKKKKKKKETKYLYKI